MEAANTASVFQVTYAPITYITKMPVVTMIWKRIVQFRTAKKRQFESKNCIRMIFGVDVGFSDEVM